MDCCVIFTLKEKYPKKIQVFTFLSFLFLIFFPLHIGWENLSLEKCCLHLPCLC